jgi:hypothetical protein
MLCHFACKFPQFVAEFLHTSRGTGRSFREETITDIMMANLKLLGRDRVIVRFPNEPRTGADMEWNFVNRSDGSYYRLLVQAKCASGERPDWSRHTYRQLSHCVQGLYQADTLCQQSKDATNPAYPVYIFYHPLHICQSAVRARLRNVEGANLANGYFVRHHAIRDERHVTFFERQLTSLRDLFCDANDDNYVPTPGDVRDYLLNKNAIPFSRAAFLHTMDIEPPPEVGTDIPEEILALIHEEDEAGPRPSDKWTVIFVSD